MLWLKFGIVGMISFWTSDAAEHGHGKLTNPPGMRSMSDKLDQAVGWEGAYKESSGPRGFIHGVWHTGAGVVGAVTPGDNNAKGEFQRAGEQFSKMWESTPAPTTDKK
jgi:hypothetical protein